jgi:hypothetical protein
MSVEELEQEYQELCKEENEVIEIVVETDRKVICYEREILESPMLTEEDDKIRFKIRFKILNLRFWKAYHDVMHKELNRLTQCKQTKLEELNRLKFGE